MIQISEIEPHFNDWELIEVASSKLDKRATVSGTPLRCIDRHFGATPEGYDPDLVPLSPAWLGATDGFAAFYHGSASKRLSRAVKATLKLNHQPASHGDYIKGDLGCAFINAQHEGLIPSLKTIQIEYRRLLRNKFGFHYLELYRPQNEVLGFLLNDQAKTTCLPEDGKYYPIDIWAAEIAGIDRQRALAAIAICGNLILKDHKKVLYIAR